MAILDNHHTEIDVTTKWLKQLVLQYTSKRKAGKVDLLYMHVKKATTFFHLNHHNGILSSQRTKPLGSYSRLGQIIKTWPNHQKVKHSFQFWNSIKSQLYVAVPVGNRTLFCCIFYCVTVFEVKDVHVAHTLYTCIRYSCIYGVNTSLALNWGSALTALQTQ